MAEILIDRCTFRVVRRQGWSWGPAPERFIDYALQRLPDLLAAKLEGLLPEDADGVYEAPLRISIKLPSLVLDEESSSGSSVLPASASFASFAGPVGSALSVALGKPHPIPSKSGSFSPSKQLRFVREPVELPRPSSGDGPLGHFLLALVAKNELRHFLGLLSVEELEIWHAALRHGGEKPREIQEERIAPILVELETAFSSQETSAIADPGTLLRVRLVVAAQTAAKLRLPLRDHLLWIALDRFSPLSLSTCFPSREMPPTDNEFSIPGFGAPVEPPALANPDAAADIRGSASSDSEEWSTRVQGVPFLRHVPLRGNGCSADLGTVLDAAHLANNAHPSAGELSCDSAEWSTRVESVLPFLLLGPLRSVGYFSALGAVLDVARLANKAHLMAAALAYKVLDPPERGWRRLASVRHAAAVVAGSPSPLQDEELLQFSRLIAPYTGPLDRWLVDSADSSRDKHSPVLLRRVESELLSGFLVVDPSGCFPLGHVDDAPASVALLQKLNPPVVLVSSEASGPSVLRELHRSRLAFVTDAPPVRGEAWHPVMQGPSRLGWTNHSDPSSEFLVRAARTLEISALEAAALWEQFGIARPAVPRAKFQALERCVTLAASIALGILAWQLWKERGRTTPQQALERLRDFGASVQSSGKALQVGLPRGRRYSELLDAGLLTPVPDIPWLRGRRVEFELA